MPKLRYVKGELCITPTAKDLIFPEQNGGARYFGDFPGRIEQAEDPSLQEALERDGHEAFADGAPRGPAYPLWALGIAAEMYTEAQEDPGNALPDEDEGIGNTDEAAPMNTCGQICDCRTGTCMLAGAIKARNGKSSSERPKIPRGHVPIACGQCLNSFG